MKFVRKITLLLVVLITSGCAGGLNSIQKREYAAFQHDGVLIEEKTPALGGVLGILPGFGSFYAREPVYGILNLLLWPASVLWDPISGYDGAMTINYDITKYHIKKVKEQEIIVLDDQLSIGEIDHTEYVLAKRKVEQKYNY